MLESISMPIRYTNHRGATFYLCQGVTRTGKPRYYFAREPKGHPVETIPEGFEITESVNGVVSLAKVRPTVIRPEEEALVRQAVAAHKKAYNYRVGVKGPSIVVYEREGADPAEVAQFMAQSMRLPLRRVEAEVRDEFDRHARFTPVLRFTLDDPEKRTFWTERWSWHGDIDNWVEIDVSGPLARCVKRTVPKLDTDEFFELM